jgi:tetratricopeptide (TPR) repeat protein/polyferredoxin
MPGACAESSAATPDGGLIHVGAGTVQKRARGDTGSQRSAPPRARPLKYARWRAMALASVYVLFGVHIAHWRLNGSTLAPLELNEVMYTLEAGVVTAGFLLMATLFLATAFVGRFFCSWACHIIALEDLCAWLLAKAGIRTRPVRSRLLLLVPSAALLYMFVWPQILRIHQGRPLPRLRVLTDEADWASFVTSDFWRNLPDPWIAGLTFAVCGFAVVYFLGSRSFCLHACPYGAVFAAVDRIAPGRISLTGHCEQCGICTSICSSHVRVHEEIARFGKVVDTSCMKDLDCVSACPQQALSFRFTRPAGLDSFSATGRRRLRYDFSLAEELMMAAIFLAVLLVFRGLYTAVPFLMTLGLAGIVSYLTLICLRLARRPDVRLIPFRLKRAGRLTTSGTVFGAMMTVFGLFFVHSAYIRYHEALGQRAFDAVRLAWERAEAPLPSDSLRSAVHHLTAARRRGLFRPLVRDQQLASLHLKGADPALAQPYLRRIVDADPWDTDSRLALAQLLAKSGRLEDAETETRAMLAAVDRSAAGKAPDRPPELAGGYALLGAIHAARDESEAAIEAYRTAAAEDPANVPVRMALGGLLAEGGRYSEAAATFREAATLRPDLAEASFNLAVALEKSGNETGAIEAYEEMLVLFPHDVETLLNLGFLVARRGDLAAAAEHFRRAVELQPELARAHFNLGVILNELGDRPRAAEHYRRAAELDPGYAEKVRRLSGEKPVRP